MKQFSDSARAELAHLRTSQSCCAHAELAGILRVAGSLHLHGLSTLSLTVGTEHADVARKIILLLRQAASIPADVVVEEHKQRQHQRIYMVRLDPGQAVRDLLVELGALGRDGQLLKTLSNSLLHKQCCRTSFLRGAYMMRGSVCDPRGNGYHLEIVVGTSELAQGLRRVLGQVHLKSNCMERKGQHVVYIKDADDIAVFLTTIGAQAARLELEEVRVLKEIRGGVNRLVNAETANVDKTVIAAMEQVAWIEALAAKGAMDRLPDTLRDLARTRLENPEASLRELGQLLPKPASKSAVNHRFRRLKKYVEAILNG